MSILISIVAIVVAYLFGAIPVGFLVAKAYGVDITASGSGRTGGTNVLRVAGPIAAGLTVMGDIFKGLIPVYFIESVFPAWVVAIAMVAAVLGHNYSIFLKFKGGVGAGTAVGAMGGAFFWAGFISGIAGLIALVVSRYASLLSTAVAVTGVLTFTLFAILGYTPYIYILGAVLTLLLMFYALRPNFARIKAGTERKVGKTTEGPTV